MRATVSTPYSSSSTLEYCLTEQERVLGEHFMILLYRIFRHCHGKCYCGLSQQKRSNVSFEQEKMGVNRFYHIWRCAVDPSKMHLQY